MVSEQGQFFNRVIEKVLQLTAATSILVLFLIFFFLFREGIGVFRTVGVTEFIFGQRWLPVSEPPRFGALPLFMGSLFITGGAVLVAVPVGIGIAIYLAEGAPASVREGGKVFIELLACIPSVVYGFLGLMILAPLVKEVFGLPSGLSVFTASLVLGIMALPTVVSIAEDALRAVPQDYRAASLALGASHWETALKVVVPTASSGLLAAALLGMGRAIGETMAVLMVAGNALVIPNSPFSAARTVTAGIAAEMGEVVFGGLHYQALFGLGIVLLLITFVINLVADLCFQRSGQSGGGA